MRTFAISCIFIFLVSYCTAQLLPRDPRYRLAYLEAQLEEIQMLPEEERFLCLSYTSVVGNDYRRVVEDMIVSKGVLKRMESEGMTQADRAYKRKVEKLEKCKQVLRKKTKRILGYFELEIKICRQALEEVLSEEISEEISGYIRWDYYQAVELRITLEELKKMPEEEMFLYLRDHSWVDRSFYLLIEERDQYKKDLDEFRASGVDEDDEKYQLTKEGFERITAAIRLEAGRIIKGRAFRLMILDRSWRKAKEQIKEQETTPEI